MTTKQEYSSYLEKNFTNQEIKASLFFNGNIGLRFDLQVGETGTNEYFTEVFRRSVLLFEQTFDPTDDIFLVLRDYKWKRRKLRLGNYCFKQIYDLKNNEVDYFVIRNLYEKDKNDVYNNAVLKLKASRLNYENILTAIANTDFPPRLPRFKFLSNAEIYFINTTKNLIFFMYDDRGLDIIASDIEALRPIYIKFNSWILDANREQIDDIMKQKNPA